MYFVDATANLCVENVPNSPEKVTKIKFLYLLTILVIVCETFWEFDVPKAPDDSSSFEIHLSKEISYLSRYGTISE